MTTKYKIIAGFFFLMALLAALAAFGYSRLNIASSGFDAFRSEARTTVNANAADALMREAKDRMTNFVLNLDPSFADAARKALEDSGKYIAKAIEVEESADDRRNLTTQQEHLAQMGQLSKAVQDNLLLADKKVLEQMGPTGEAINDNLSAINASAVDNGNAGLLNLLDDAYSVYAELRVSVRTYSATYLGKDAEAAYKHFQELDAVLKKMQGQISREDTRKAFATLRQGYDSYLGYFKEAEALMKAGMQAKKDMDTTAVNASKFFDEYTSVTQKHLDEQEAATFASNENAQKLLAVASGVGILLGLAFAAWIILGVMRVLTRVSSFADEVAHGHFDAQLSVSERGEIGVMVESLKAIPVTLTEMMAEYQRLERRVEEGHINAQADDTKFSGGFAALVQGSNNILRRLASIFDVIPSPVVVLSRELKAQYLNKTAQSLAGTDYAGKTCKELFNREDDGTPQCSLTNAVRNNAPSTGETVAHPQGRRLDIQYTAIPMNDAQGKLASVLQLIIDLTQIKDTERRIVEVARQASENADRVAAASEQLSAQVEQVSRGADMQRSRVESTAAAMNEMNATVLEVARSAGNASEQSDETRKKADNGADLVNKVVRAINGVNTVAVTLQDNMKELGQQAESIGGVMNVISDIADQTNLLALNAAIEAARAGEAGRGFAVVADEVRKLAEKTMSATQEVGSNIQAIQNSARTNINEVTNAVTNIAEATDLANASGQALNEIVHLAATNSSFVASIATAAEEQSATSEEINRALEDVSRVVAETADGMIQASSAVQDLSRVAQELKVLIERLRAN